MNIAYHVERASRLFPEKPALIFEGKSFTYSQLNRLANRLANGLKKLGINRGERVALFLPNIPEFIIAYLGILKLGAVVVSVNAMLKSAEVRYILDDSAAKIVITTEELREQVPADLPKLEQIFIAEGKNNKGISLAQVMENTSPQGDTVNMESNAPAAIVYTSGTTGFPKGATLSHANIISNMYSQNRCCGMSSDDRMLLYLPLFHCFGQNAILNSAFNVCATVILQRSFKLKTIAAERVTMFFGVPIVFIKLLNAGISASYLSSIRYFFSAAAPLPVEISQLWYQKYGLVINEGYGLTETSPCACYNNDLKYKFGSVGTPIENVEVKVVNSQGREVLPRMRGEVVIKGPNVMLGYWNRPLDTAKVIKNGWLHTGDIGWMDEDGYFYIVDRLNDTINTSGFKIYPTEVENIIYQHPAVAEVAVYGTPHPSKGEIVRANIILKAGQQITPAEMIVWCRQKMASYKVPQVLSFVNSIPKSKTGKILKRLLREEAMGLLCESSTDLFTIPQSTTQKLAFEHS